MLSYSIVICLVFCQFFATLYCTLNNLYQFEPASRNIEVSQNTNSIQFGFHAEKQDEFVHCYYSTSEGTIFGDFSIESNQKTYLKFENLRENFKKLPNCGLLIDKVDDNTPQKWIMTVENKNGENQTETVTLSFTYEMEVFLKTVNVVIGSTFYNYLTPPKNVVIKSCSILLDNNETIELVKDFNNCEIPNNSLFTSRLINLHQGICGFKLTKVCERDSENITFLAVDNSNKNYKVSTNINKLNPGIEIKNTTYEADLEESLQLHCGGTEESSQRYCHLHNPQGKLVLIDSTCDYHIPSLTMDHFGVWRCCIGYFHNMENIVFSAEVVEKTVDATTSIETWSKDKTFFYSIGCRVKNIRENPALYCKFTRPDGTVLKTETGSATERYTSFSTDLEKGFCGIEITNPVRDNERGTWKCEINYENNVKLGAFLNIKEKTNIDFNYTKKIIAKLDSSFTLKCMVSYSSNHCYFISPNGKLHLPSNSLSTSSLGECSLTVDAASFEDEGFWSCFFARENGIPDEEFTIEVSLIDSRIIPEDAEVLLGEPAELFCNAGSPLNYCRFVAPDRRMTYSLRTPMTKNEKINYIGRGLKYGDCGISISHTEEDDGGQWTCYVASTENIENYANVTLSVLKPIQSIERVGESIAITIGVIALLILMFLFFYHRRNTTVEDNVKKSSVTEVPN